MRKLSVLPYSRFSLKKLAGFALLQLTILGIFLAVLAPATLLDKLLRQGTGARFALLLAEGSFWNGQGQLAALDAASGQYRPVLPLSWRWDVAAIFRGSMSWQLAFTAGHSVRLDMMPSGVQLGSVTFDLPARPLMEQIPNTIGRLGWQGDLRFTSPGWKCSWGGECKGSLAVNWWGASLEIFPDHPLGNYVLNISAEPDHLALGLTTVSGGLQIIGSGVWKQGKQPTVSGTITGEAYFLSRLPNVAGQWIKKGNSPESLFFAL